MKQMSLVGVLLVCTAWAGPASGSTKQEAASKKEFEIVAERFKFTPTTIEVTQGDRVKLTVKSADSTHGFEIKKLRIKKEIPKGGEPVVIEFVANEAGSFEIACSEYCGNGHKEMKAILVVAPKAHDKH